ncbi:MAG TPA: hypothetical protein VIQ30_18885 [Pseudonocardia sp.]
MATRRSTEKAAAAPPPKPMTPDEAVAEAVRIVRAPFEAIRDAQQADAAESKGD